MAALELPYEHYISLNGGEHCGICQRPPSGSRRLHRDHDHTGEGRARGLLCFRCNTALRGYMDAAWLEAAARYVRRTAA